MRITISTQSIRPMRDALIKLRRNKLSRSELDRVLSNRDYVIEFTRYSLPDLPVCGIKKAEFMDYLFTALKTPKEGVANPRLRTRHMELLRFINGLDKFNDSYMTMFKLSDGDMIKVRKNLDACFGQEQVNKLGDLTILLTIGVGNSFGWVYDKYIHFDIVQLCESVKDKETLLALLSHELNHIVMSQIYDESEPELTPLDEFLVTFSFEGLAVKFNNNAEGVLSKALYPNRPVNMALDHASWDHHRREFPLALAKLKSDIEQIKSSNLKASEIGVMLQDFWMKPDIVSLIDGAELETANYRNYFMGSELFGAIYDCFGRERMLQVIQKPSEIIPAFNEAAIQKGRPELAIL